MTIVCTGWKRLTPTVAIHDPKCDMQSSSPDLDASHGMSKACERLFRIDNGLPVERPTEEK